MSSASNELVTSTEGQKTKQVSTSINIQDPKPIELMEGLEDNNTETTAAQVENIEKLMNDDNEEEESNDDVLHGTVSVNSNGVHPQ